MKSDRKREAVPQETAQTTPGNPAYQEAVRRFSEACEAVRARKTAVYEAFLKVQDAYMSGDITQTKLPNVNPFDLSAVEAAMKDTGSPIEAKRYVNYARAVAAPITTDEEFCGAILQAVNAIGKDAIAEDDRLTGEIAAAERELEEETARLEEKVKQAKRALQRHRGKVSGDFVKPVLDLDLLHVGNLPGCFVGVIGGRMLGLQSGPHVSVRDQLQSLLFAVRTVGKASPPTSV